MIVVSTNFPARKLRVNESYQLIMKEDSHCIDKLKRAVVSVHFRNGHRIMVDITIFENNVILGTKSSINR